MGSPPRARGARPKPRRECPADRITPACAGSTERNWPTAMPSPDHPRVRGEHRGWAEVGTWLMGSPPRARGAQLRVLEVDVVARITPACAGSTARALWNRDNAGDHPRVRGEHLKQFIEAWTPQGSPPRARGARLPGPRGDVNARITPACAGSTGRQCRLSATSRDHPRVRGEHGRSSWLVLTQSGSPPRARGAPRR